MSQNLRTILKCDGLILRGPALPNPVPSFDTIPPLSFVSDSCEADVLCSSMCGSVHMSMMEDIDTSLRASQD